MRETAGILTLSTAMSPVGSCDGAIARLLLTVPSQLVQHLAAAYVDFFSQMPPYTSLVVVTHQSAVPLVSRLLADAGVSNHSELVALGDSQPLSVWAQDHFMAMNDVGGGPVTWLGTSQAETPAGLGLVDALTQATNLRHVELPLHIDGGNLLVGDEFLLIGADSLAHSTTSSDQIRSCFGCGRRLFIVGSRTPVQREERRPITIVGQEWSQRMYWGNKRATNQPLFHIDLFLTLAGRSARGNYRILVGDPSAAAELLGRPVVPHMMQPAFDQIAEQFAGWGFDVIRNPLPLVYMDEPEKKLRTWYFASSNNAWVQSCSRHGRIVWLPAYGHGNWPELTATDRANADIWQALGYEVRMVRNCQVLAENLGGLHCLGKCLVRGGQNELSHREAVGGRTIVVVGPERDSARRRSGSPAPLVRNRR